MEEWKDIKGYENYYQISSFGRVKNVKTGKILNGDTNNVGYKRVWLYTPVKKDFLFIDWWRCIFVTGIKKDLL